MNGEEHSMDEQNGPPVTGDGVVDRVLTDLETQLRGDQPDAVSALTDAHRRLQARLTDPGPTPPIPG